MDFIPGRCWKFGIGPRTVFSHWLAMGFKPLYVAIEGTRSYAS